MIPNAQSNNTNIITLKYKNSLFVVPSNKAQQNGALTNGIVVAIPLGPASGWRFRAALFVPGRRAAGIFFPIPASAPASAATSRPRPTTVAPAEFPRIAPSSLAKPFVAKGSGGGTVVPPAVGTTPSLTSNVVGGLSVANLGGSSRCQRHTITGVARCAYLVATARRYWMRSAIATVGFRGHLGVIITHLACAGSGF